MYKGVIMTKIKDETAIDSAINNSQCVWKRLLRLKVIYVLSTSYGYRSLDCILLYCKKYEEMFNLILIGLRGKKSILTQSCC